MGTSGMAFRSITVFFPAYNDAPIIGSLVADAIEVLRQWTFDYEVIVVDDGSVDTTACVLADLERRFSPRVRVITHAVNRGYGGALRSGFAAASKDLVFYTDGDGQYDVNELSKLLVQMEPDVGLVNGYKRHRSDPLHRVLIGLIYNACARLLFNIHIRDIDCDFRLIRRELLKSIELTSTSGSVCLELVRKLELTGYRVVEVGVNHYPRLHGSSQFFRLPSLLATFRQLTQLYLNLVLTPWLQHWHAKTARPYR